MDNKNKVLPTPNQVVTPSNQVVTPPNQVVTPPNQVVTPPDIKTKIVLINGQAESGKNQVVTYLQDIDNTVQYISTITRFKNIAKEHFSWDEIKDEKGRRLLSDIKLAYIRYNPTFMVDLITHGLILAKLVGSSILIIDVRDIEEIKKAKEHFPDSITLLVTRPNQTTCPDNEADLNVSNLNYDYTIHNNYTLQYLYWKVREFYRYATKSK